MEEPEKKTKTLVQRLYAIMSEVGSVAKAGENQHFKYKYVKEADVTEHMRELLCKHGVLLMPSIGHAGAAEGMENVVQVMIHYTFINVDDQNDKMTITFYGDGQDKGDKGIFKAITGAHKYMFLKTFQIGTDDDPENDSHERPAQPPRKYRYSLARIRELCPDDKERATLWAQMVASVGAVMDTPKEFCYTNAPVEGLEAALIG